MSAGAQQKTQGLRHHKTWAGQDSNLRPWGYEPRALTG